MINRVFMEDKGRYGCTANNSAGFQRHEAYLEVASMLDFLLYFIIIIEINLFLYFLKFQTQENKKRKNCRVL